MSPDVKDAVDTSINFAYATLKSVSSSSSTSPPSSSTTDTEVDGLIAHFFARSSSDHQMNEVERKLTSFGRLSGCIIGDRFNYFPGWQPDSRSPSLKVMLSAHEKLFKRKPKVYSVHAGLECGLIQGRYPNMDCVSIGPQIDHAHSPEEQLLIPSVEPFYNWLKETITMLGKVPNAKKAKK